MPSLSSRSPIFACLLIALVLLVACQRAPATSVVAPPPAATVPVGPSAAAPREVPLWPEGSTVLQQGIRALAGRDNAVVRPSLLVYPGKAGAARPAVLVFPGGGFKALAIGRRSTLGFDGADVCGWLADAGARCILVKYRVPDTACHWNPDTRRHEQPDVPMALQDAQRAISLVRHHAGEWGIDPHKVGVMGFSAGGHLAVLSSTAFEARSYTPVDAVDATSSRPDFAIPVYPGHMTMEHRNRRPRELAARELNPDIVVSAQVPPTLLVHAKDDAVDPVHYSEVYARALEKAGVDVALGLYDTGGHAFGVAKQGTDTDRWMDDALGWMRERGILGGGSAQSVEPIVLEDPGRGRRVPIALYRPGAGRCEAARCGVVLLSPGYGLAHTDYGFLAQRLSAAGDLVVAIRHDLPSDPPLARTGDLMADRMPMWQRGAETLRFVLRTLPSRHPEYDWSRPVLLGHSNGGDLSALALHDTPSLAATLVTLDNRRYPLPRDPALRVLSVRGADFEADPGVLPAAGEATSMCIGEIPGSRHDDMNDDGPDWLKAEISRRVLDFLREGKCDR